MERIALFAGSFDPFTIGHQDIVRRGLCLFDKIVVGIGVNPAKKPWMPVEERMARIRTAFANEPKVEVAEFQGLAQQFAQEIGAKFLLRGVRSVADFEYERSMADANRLISDDKVETVILMSQPGLAVVSSSLVRELAHFGGDYQKFIP